MMSKDLKGYLKNNKNNKMSSENHKKANDIANGLSQKSQKELSQDFQSALMQAKSNGTFNKDEMIKMLAGIKGNMSNAEFERVKGIILSL